MSWQQLVTNVHAFEIAADWRVGTDPARELPTATNGSVYRFTIAGQYLVGLCGNSEYRDESDWYTTITEKVSDQLPVGSYVEWTHIATYGQHIQAVTSGSSWSDQHPGYVRRDLP